MDTEIENGRVVSLQSHNMTPLDIAILQFEKQAKTYYAAKQQAPAETPEE